MSKDFMSKVGLTDPTESYDHRQGGGVRPVSDPKTFPEDGTGERENFGGSGKSYDNDWCRRLTKHHPRPDVQSEKQSSS